MSELKGKRITLRLSNYNADGIWYLHSQTKQSQNQLINSLLSHALHEELKKWDKPDKSLEDIIGKSEPDLLGKMLKADEGGRKK
jgi:hypothetical protein